MRTGCRTIVSSIHQGNVAAVVAPHGRGERAPGRAARVRRVRRPPRNPRPPRLKAKRCERFAAASATRPTEDNHRHRRPGRRDRRLVVGRPRLRPTGETRGHRTFHGKVHITGFSGSSFSRFSRRLRGRIIHSTYQQHYDVTADPHQVVVDYGLNDYDQPDAEIRAGFERLMRAACAVSGVVVVGPIGCRAHREAAAVPRVDALLARLSADTTAWRTSAPRAGHSATSTTTCTSPPPATGPSATASRRHRRPAP